MRRVLWVLLILPGLFLPVAAQSTTADEPIPAPLPSVQRLLDEAKVAVGEAAGADGSAAMALYDRAILLAREGKDAIGEAHTHVARELLLAKIGKKPEAYAALREAFVAWDRSTYGPGHVLSLGLQAGMELATDKARAEDLLRQARARAEQERRWPRAAAAAIIDIGRGLAVDGLGRVDQTCLRCCFPEGK